MYLKHIAPPQIIRELMRRLKKIDIDGVIDSNYITEHIRDGKLSLFRSTGSTERPDIIAGKVLKGRVAVFVDGSPAVLTVPFLFIENFQSNEDYYLNFYYHESRVLFNGEAHQDRYAFILLSGNVHPKYYVASVSNKKLFADKAVVTASHGNRIQTVDNAPMGEYLKRLGLIKNEDGTGLERQSEREGLKKNEEIIFEVINSFPLLVDLNDGTLPAVRVMFSITSEGYAVCGGDVPVGATLSVGRIDAAEVIATAAQKIAEAIKDGGHDCIIGYSCIGRYFFLGHDTKAEINKIKELMKDTDIPYHFAYSGSEICPVYSGNAEGNTVNRSHNLTLIVCAL